MSPFESIKGRVEDDIPLGRSRDEDQHKGKKFSPTAHTELNVYKSRLKNSREDVDRDSEALLIAIDKARRLEDIEDLIDEYRSQLPAEFLHEVKDL